MVQLELPLEVGTLRGAFNHLLANGLECEDWTRRMHASHTKYLLEWFGDGPLPGVTYPRLLEYYRSELKRGRARETVRKRLSTMHMALAEAVRMGWLEKLPPWVVIKSDSRPKKDYWTVTQWEAANLACDDEDLAMFIAQGFWFGSHTSDIYRQRWQDIDLVKNTWIRRNTKSKAEPAELPIPERMRELLIARKDRLQPHPRDLVCGRNLGHPNRQLKALAARCDLPAIRPIGLRHSCVTYLKDCGCDDDFRCFWIGHKGVAVTKRVYTHMTPGQVEAGMALANRR